MTNPHTPAALKLITRLTLPQFDAVRFHSRPKWAEAPILSLKAPRRSTVAALVKKGVLEVDCYTYKNGVTVEFFKLTALGWEVAYQLGDLAAWDMHAAYLSVIAKRTPRKGDRVVLNVAGREVVAEVARVIDSVTIRTFEQSDRGYFGEFNRSIFSIIKFEEGAALTAIA